MAELGNGEVPKGRKRRLLTKWGETARKIDQILGTEEAERKVEAANREQKARLHQALDEEANKKMKRQLKAVCLTGKTKE